MNIRHAIREKRRSLSETDRQNAEKQIYHTLFNHPKIQSAKHLGLFLSFDGEVNTRPIIEFLWALNKSVYLPVIHPFTANNLLFLSYTPKTVLVQNQFGILQPQLNVNQVAPHQILDVIITPLVAFDERGYRMGMGRGYYDRLLMNYEKHGTAPMGIAFRCQKIDKIENQPWDVKLPEIIYA